MLCKAYTRRQTTGPRSHCVAERILTTDELKSYVDSVPELRVARPARYEGENPRELKEILARRLVREERYKEASRYFQTQQRRELLREYAEVIRTARDRSRQTVERAPRLVPGGQVDASRRYGAYGI